MPHLKQRWHNSLDPVFESQIMRWGYTMCGWPHWYARWTIRKAQLKTFLFGTPKPTQRNSGWTWRP